MYVMYIYVPCTLKFKGKTWQFGCNKRRSNFTVAAAPCTHISLCWAVISVRPAKLDTARPSGGLVYQY